MYPLVPATKKYVYLNAASTGPLSLPAEESMEQALCNYVEDGRIPDPVWQRDVEETRKLAGELIGASADEIAFIRNTSDGLIFAIESIIWEEGDNVILFKDGFPANRIPFEKLLPSYVERRYVSIRSSDPESEIIKMMDKHTKAISIDWVDFLTGRRIDLKTLIENIQKNRIFLIVDAIQGLGALDLNISGISILSSGASKWMLGPYGTGILYVSSGIMGRLKPSRIGWLSFAWKDYSSFDVSKNH
jgi:selenocysteine lyase/cysteine desulfurase